MQPRIKPAFTVRDHIKAFVSVIAAALLGGLRRGLHSELLAIERTDVDLPLAGLPDEWDGARIAAVADLHAKTRRPIPHIERAVDLVNDAGVDIVAVLGDTIDTSARIPARLVDHLGAMQATVAKFAIMGNHDYYGHRPDRLMEILTRAGFDLLVNSHRILYRNGQPLCIGGLDDAILGRPDLDAVFAGADENAPRLLLCHNPDVAESLSPALHVAAMLCGHSHGGQILLPLVGRPLLPLLYPKYALGLVAGPVCPVYVSRGLGTAGLPLRYCCRPELPVITLRRREAN